MAHRDHRTDPVETRCLEKARAGVYTQFEVQRGLPIQLLLKYFQQSGDTWRLDPSIRAMVQYKQMNLLDEFRQRRRLRRRVLPQRADLLRQRDQGRGARQDREVDRADGFLVLGAAETVVGLTGAYKPLTDARGVYVRVATPAPVVGRSASSAPPSPEAMRSPGAM